MTGPAGMRAATASPAIIKPRTAGDIEAARRLGQEKLVRSYPQYTLLYANKYTYTSFCKASFARNLSSMWAIHCFLMQFDARYRCALPKYSDETYDDVRRAGSRCWRSIYPPRLP